MTETTKNPAKPTRPGQRSHAPPQIDVSKITDFEISLLLLERDVSQYRVERFDDLLNKIGEAKGFAEAENKPASFVPEQTFLTLKWEPAKGERLGEFEVANKNSNLPDKWSHAYKILRQNNAVINSRYHAPNYEHSYWLYGEDRIYRQKRKQQT